MTDAHRRSDTCGCCRDPLELVRPSNPPGLSSIAYRIGTHPTFLDRMVARLPREALAGGALDGARPLENLTARDPDDLGIALMDAWATVADVLTFYQERIANEGFLRTATERRSILELARQIGYELAPPVAAQAVLAFDVEDAPGSPGRVDVPSGTRVQSVPAQGEDPQTFETGSDLHARAAWNAVPLRRRRTAHPAVVLDRSFGRRLVHVDWDGSLPEDHPDVKSVDPRNVYPVGTWEVPDEPGGDVRAVPLDLIHVHGSDTGVSPGDTLLVVGRRGSGALAVVHTVHSVTVDRDADTTRIDLAEAAHEPPYTTPSPPPADPPAPPVALTEEAVDDIVRARSWTDAAFQAFISEASWDPDELDRLIRGTRTSRPDPRTGVFVLRESVAFFGHNAPLFGSLPDGGEMREDPYAPLSTDTGGSNSKDWDAANGERGRTIWQAWDGTTYQGADAYLERVVRGLTPGSWAVVRDGAGPPLAYWIDDVRERSLTGFGLSAKAHGLAFRDVNTQSAAPTGGSRLYVRETTADVRSEPLQVAGHVIAENVNATTTELELDGPAIGIHAGRHLVITGKRADAREVEHRQAVVVNKVEHRGGRTVLWIEPGLSHALDRQSVEVQANAAEATNGETGKEVLGSGDGRLGSQRFKLRRTPLTYLRAPSATGSRSTLEVRVDGIAWDEVPTLFGAGAEDPVYTIRHGDDGTATVQFGDGRQGARLPSRTENVVATYRNGGGPGGNVDAEALSVLLDRPLGLRGVTNPTPARGGAAGEGRDHARRNAPMHVMTLGRIVSLQDYEDYALTYPGVTKAFATGLITNGTRSVHVTVAGEDPTPLDRSSPVIDGLYKAIIANHDPGPEVMVQAHVPVQFDLEVRVVVEPAYEDHVVRAAVREALLAALSFPSRDLAAPVTAADVIRTAHAVDGVHAVAIDRLAPSGAPDDEPVHEVMVARSTRIDGEDVLPAQLLVIERSGLKVTLAKEVAS